MFRCLLLLTNTLPGASSSPQYKVYHNYVQWSLSGKARQVCRNPRRPVKPAISFRVVLSNIFSIIMCIRYLHRTGSATYHSGTELWAFNGTSCTSTFWRLEFGVAPRLMGNLRTPLLCYTKYYHYRSVPSLAYLSTDKNFTYLLSVYLHHGIHCNYDTVTSVKRL
jgi:hypothetical protein